MRPCASMGTLIPRVRIGVTLTVACPWAWREASGRVDVPVSVGVLFSSEKVCGSSQSVVLVTPGSRVVKTIFVKGVDGSTRVHRVKGHTVVGDLLDCTVDVCVTYNGNKVDFGKTMPEGGAQRYRQPPIDIPDQWTCLACGQEWVWPVKNRCFRCGCRKGHAAPLPDPCVAGLLGRLLQRSAPTNST